MSSPIPVFSKYLRVSDGTQVAIHKFVIDQNDPPDSNEFTWNVKRLKSNLNVVGALLASGRSQANQIINVTVDTSDENRTTAKVTLSKANLEEMFDAGDVNPHSLYFVTFHDKSDVNSNIRTS